MSHETVEQIRQSIRKLEEEIEESRAERVSRGLPADIPDRFVELPMSWTLYHKCKPLIDYAVEYTSLCDKADEVIDILDEQMTWIESYEMNVIFLSVARNNLGLIALGIEGIYNSLTQYEKYETAGELVRDIVKFIGMTYPDYANEYRLDDFTYDYKADSKENAKIFRDVQAEVDRLEDAEYFEKEYDKLVDHYESIKHLY